jgi:hypothetical protein
MNRVSLLTTAFAVVATLSALGQEPMAVSPTPLSQLLVEAAANNPQISAADHEARAVRQMAPQVTTLPDPKVTYQQFSVGSPKPFAGYTNSDFAYIGIGASQELPYPGKLRLRGQVAERDADTKQAEVEVAKTSIADAIKADYLPLAYLQQTLGIFQQNEGVLDQLIQDATDHYKVGQGMQQDVLQAQVERTKIVREITMHHQQMWQLQAHLKGLLDHDQGSAEIFTEDLAESPFKRTSPDLLAMVRQNNPQIVVDASSIQKQDAQLTSAKREGKPDFELGYMYQNTDRTRVQSTKTAWTHFGSKAAAEDKAQRLGSFGESQTWLRATEVSGNGTQPEAANRCPVLLKSRGPPAVRQSCAADDPDQRNARSPERTLRASCFLLTENLYGCRRLFCYHLNTMTVPVLSATLLMKGGQSSTPSPHFQSHWIASRPIRLASQRRSHEDRARCLH